MWREEFEKGHGFRGAFEHAAIGMALCDPSGRYLKVNASLCRIVGYGEDELLTMDFQSITHPDDLEGDLSLARQLWDGEIDHFHLEKRYVHKQGHLIWVLLSVSAVLNDQGQLWCTVSQVQDITARKTAELDAARRLQEIKRLTRTVSEVLRTLESAAGDGAYLAVLRIILDTFDSPAGLFLRFSDRDALVGPYAHETGSEDVHCLPPDRDALWARAFESHAALVENAPRPMGCGRTVARSLVAPILYDGMPCGLFHIGDGAGDYDAHDRDLLARVAEIIAPVIAARIERDKLTPREAEVMDLIVGGKSQKEIAAELGISVQTIAKHRAKVLEKLHVKNDVELVHLAVQMRAPRD